MKKLALLVVISTLVLTLLSACSSSNADTTGYKSTESAGVRKFQGTTLHMIAEQQNPTLALKKQLDKFEKLTGIKVELEMGPFDSVVQKITLAMQSGSDQYDIIATPYQFLGNLVVNHFIQPLTPLMNREDLKIIKDYNQDDIVKGMWDASGKWENEVYGVPANSAIQFLAYRKDLFENEEEKAAFKAKYGYDLTVPKDWKSYEDVAAFFTRKAGQKIAGKVLSQDFFGVTIAGKRHDALTCEWLNYAWSFGGGIFDKEGNLMINSLENIAALKYYQNLIKYAPPGVTSKTWDEQMTDMQQGIVAMGILFNDTLPSIENPEQSKVAGKMGYGAVPIGKSPAAHYGAWSYFIPSKSKKGEAAWVFLQWFNTPDVQKALALDGAFPNLQSTYQDPELAKLPYWQATLDAYKISSTRPRIPEWNSMNEELMLQLSRVIVSEVTPEQALKAVNDKYKQILEGKLPVKYQ